MPLQLNVRIGIDLGGVIIDRISNDGGDTSFFSDRYLETTAVKDAFDSIKALVDKYGQQNVFVVSKCGDATERKSKEWLHHHDFFRKTGVNKDNVRFCRNRADKAPICQRLRITHFIDDRPEVLSYLTTVPFAIHLGEADDIARDIGTFDFLQLARIISFKDWKSITSFILNG